MDLSGKINVFDAIRSPTYQRKHGITRVSSEIRDMLRTFTSKMGNPRLLRWDSILDIENGRGIRVALLDAGILWAHPTLRGARIQAHDFTNSGGIFDRTGHGTKSATILVAQGHGGIHGLVPSCTLLFGKVLGDGNLGGSARSLARAIQWVVRKKADVVILPLGRRHSSTLVTREIRRGLALGCTFFAAAGNNGRDAFLFPARLNGVKSVSAVDLDGTPLSWCCQGPNVDVYAPGKEIRSVGIEGLGTLSGSSPATVLAGGVAALQIASERRQQKDLRENASI